MTHQPATIDAGVSPAAVALAEAGRNGRLVIYAGAGVSQAEPAGLPSGRDLAVLVYVMLRDAFPEIRDCDSENLTAIADAIAALPNGTEALRRTIVGAAEFATARPTYGHRVLALLLLEGVIDVLTTNWDDCVERSGGEERVYAIVTEQDLLDVAPKAILKVHGCASRPQTLLISTADLTSPPSWVADQTRARLGASIVVFIGIGDVAGYVRSRLDEAVASVSNVDNIRVVSPSIAAEWATSQWVELAPELDANHRIAQTADAFLESLAGAYVLAVLGESTTRLVDEPESCEAVKAASSSLRAHDALTVLAWVRNAGVFPAKGVPILSLPEMTSALVAVGRAFRDGFVITRDCILSSQVGNVEVLVAVGTQSASRLRREAMIRLGRHLGNGVQALTFVVAGGVGWSSEGPVAGADVFGGADASDVVDGPVSVAPRIIRAEAVV